MASRACIRKISRLRGKSKVKIRWTFLIFLSLFGLVLSGTGAVTFVAADNFGASDSWPMFRNNSAHTGYSEEAGPLTNQTTWTYLDSQIMSSPTASDGLLYIGLNDGEVVALNASDFSKVWNFQTGGAVYTSPAVSGGVVYFGSWDTNIYAVNSLTGEKLWSYKTDSYVESSPTVVNGIAYVASYDANVTALDAATGSLIWTFATGSGAVGSSPAVVDGVLYIGDNGGNVFALEAANGQMLWRQRIGDTIYSSPAVADGVVYIGADTAVNGAVFALKASDGQVLWSYSTGDHWVYSSPAVAYGKVYVCSYNHLTSDATGNIYALDTETGQLVWTKSTGGSVFSSPAIAKNVVYIPGYDGCIYAFDAFDGDLVWSYQTAKGISWSSAIIVDNTLYVGSDDVTLYVFSSSTSLPNPTVTPTPAPNATISTLPFSMDGNISITQISNFEMNTDDNANTAVVSFAITGPNGTTGFSNMTIPKTSVPNGTVPTIYIDNIPLESQGFSENADNYYVWFTVHFSTHQISIQFTSNSPQPTQAVSVDRANGSEGEIDYIQIAHGVIVALLIIAAVLAVLKVALRDKQSKKTSAI